LFFNDIFALPFVTIIWKLTVKKIQSFFKLLQAFEEEERMRKENRGRNQHIFGKRKKFCF
jgi:hypothetical protein